jgi:hypothetical protein
MAFIGPIWMRIFHSEDCWRVITGRTRKSNHRVERTATSRLVFGVGVEYERCLDQPEFAVGGCRSPGSFAS